MSRVVKIPRGQKRQVKAGFTIVEITVVISILGCLMAVAMPKFINLSDAAKMNLENNTIGQINMAIKTQMIQNITSGLDYENAFPTQLDIIDLLQQKPPYTTIYSPSEFRDNYNDNVHWLEFPTSNNKQVRLFCPHFNGNANGTAYGVNSPECGGQGRVWIYYLESGSYSGQWRNKGDLVLETDAEH